MSKLGKLVAALAVLFVGIGRNADTLLRGCVRNADNVVSFGSNAVRHSDDFLKHSDGFFSGSRSFSKQKVFDDWKYASNELATGVKSGTNTAASKSSLKNYLANDKAKENIKSLLEEVIDLNEEDLTDDDQISEVMVQYANRKKLKTDNPQEIVDALKVDRLNNAFYTLNFNRCQKNTQKINGESKAFINIAPKFSLPYQYHSQVDSLVNQLKSKKLESSDMVVISLETSDATKFQLTRYFGDQHVVLSSPGKNQLLDQIKQLKQGKKLIFILAPVENGQIVVKAPNQHTAERFNFDEVTHLASTLNLNVFLLGCKNNLKDGIKRIMLPMVAIKYLNSGIKSNQSLLSLLNHFAKNGVQVLVKPNNTNAPKTNSLIGVISMDTIPFEVMNHQSTKSP
ncbi:hypothetical protein BKI52_31195 [marine bacterium AO1-C]|nr:hypothetical protein BKI52_31195 [marine bacterium AO1-C]